MPAHYPKDHPLSPFFILGVAFGDFDIHAGRKYADVDNHPLPDIRDIAARASAIPETFLERCPCLKFLAKIRKVCDRTQHPSAILLYHRANRMHWGYPSENLNNLSDVLALSHMASAHLRSAEREVAGTPDESWMSGGLRGAGLAPVIRLETGVRWDAPRNELRFRGEKICEIAAQGIKMRRILEEFEHVEWIGLVGR